MKRLIILLLMLYIILSISIPLHISINNSNEQSKEVTLNIAKSISENVYEVNKISEVQQDPYEKAIAQMRSDMDKIENIENNKKLWFISYKSIIEKYDGLIDPPETIYDYFTEEEINLICRVVETETHQCDFDSKVNVANVVFNRLEHEAFDDTVFEVVTSDNQFAYWRKKISDDTLLAVEYAFMFEDTTNGALYFHSNKKKETFCGKKYIFSDNAVHHFY